MGEGGGTHTQTEKKMQYVSNTSKHTNIFEPGEDVTQDNCFKNIPTTEQKSFGRKPSVLVLMTIYTQSISRGITQPAVSSVMLNLWPLITTTIHGCIQQSMYGCMDIHTWM